MTPTVRLAGPAAVLALLAGVLLARHVLPDPSAASPPGAPPTPEWAVASPYLVTDNGVQLAALRAVVNPAHVTALFFAIGLPADLDGWMATPTDLRVVDQGGYVYPSRVAWLDAVGRVRVGGVAIGALRAESTTLTLAATSVRATSPGGDVQTIAGHWNLSVLNRYGTSRVAYDGVVDRPLTLCFRVGDVAVSANLADQCAAIRTPPTIQPKPSRPVPTWDPSAVLTQDPTPVIRPADVPYPTPGPQLPTPTRVPESDFTDWSRGTFGVALLVSSRRPHRVFALVKQDGTIAAASRAEFEAATR